ncbi:PIN domain-containing protein [Candidatus Venteria ishoeyi]|uniref:PIN domain protein n=1 Tax=Candidatus Venteria ishoeyi TaxID=1899563 RepID=A0A1H6FEZ6_9GAMM|nr:PIN domain-containing protein [Candidatus Venteria ishoeyi]MDM8548371.1 PIN domain-containing protein [Candidatus Venteria ishoeyi]SEH08223.1 PIN domain protein [Candidatus Venteria ishoeyi]
MHQIILDTNIWIYLLEGRHELNNLKAQIAQEKLIPVLNQVVFAEVLGWQEMDSGKEIEIRKYFASLKMLTLNMQHWEQIISWRKQGIKKKMPDLLIAAISKQSGYPILTRNINDFNLLDINVENPWVDNT